MELKVFTDGGSRGNPGVSGYGLAVYDETDNLIFQDAKFLGIKTNNEAEYLGLIAALTWLRDNQHKFNLEKVNFYSDSQLLVRQIQGDYKVKSDNLKGLHQVARDLLSQINVVCVFSDIRRGYNKLADSLANEAMDRRL
ncbi:MAG: ribonuclease HI family protein [Patescibacteria group bacterium]|jgi:ribonuclease HI